MVRIGYKTYLLENKKIKIKWNEMKKCANY